jgi:glutathione S-transferase
MSVALHQFAPAFGLPNGSPFCMKVEAYLRLAAIEYRCVNGALPFRAPRRKLPWIDDGGTVVADSGFIVRHLEATRGSPLDGWLSPRERAAGHALQRMLEESTYWVLLHSRWVDEQGWRLSKPQFFGALPTGVAGVVAAIARRKIRRDCLGQGIALRTPIEIAAIGRADIDALATLLEGRDFVLGNRPSSYDAVALAFVANLLRVPLAEPVRTHALGLPALVEYCDRMMARVFPEYPKPADSSLSSL